MSNLALPPEIWAGVCEYLPFRSVLSVAATSQTMLREAIPTIAVLHIHHSCEINLNVASRFRDVGEIWINSLLVCTTAEEGDGIFVDVDLETRIRVIPFLSMFRNKLRRVCFGGMLDGVVVRKLPLLKAEYSEGGDNPWGDVSYPHEGGHERMNVFIDALSGAYRSGAFPRNLEIFGLCCPSTREGGRSRDCGICLQACTSFPLNSVLCFECEGSSFREVQSGRLHRFDVCLERAQIDSVIEGRQGGHALLYSENRLLNLLGKGRRYNIKCPGGKSLNIVKYTQIELDGIKRAIDYADLDVKKLSIENVSGAVMRSFAQDDGSILPKSQCYLSGKSIRYLKAKLGLPVHDFRTDPADLIAYADRIAGIVSACWFNGEHSDYGDIRVECLEILASMLSIIKNPPAQHMNNIAIHPTKNSCCTHSYIAKAFKNVITNGNLEEEKMLVDAGAMEFFAIILVSPNSKDCAINDAVISLGGIATLDGRKDQTKKMLHTEGFLTKLSSLLASSSDRTVERSIIKLLVDFADHITRPTFMRLLPKLWRLTLSIRCSEVRANCSILLRNALLVANDDSNIQTLVNLDSVRTIADTVRTTRHRTVKTNLAHVLVILAAKVGNHMVLRPKQQKIFLSSMVYLVESDNDGISDELIFATALLNLLEGFKDAKGVEEELLRLVGPLIEIFPGAPFGRDEEALRMKPALKALSLLAAVGDNCARAIARHDGIVQLRILLSSPLKDIWVHACCAISTIICCNEDRLQDVIDHNIMPVLIKGYRSTEAEWDKIRFLIPICQAVLLGNVSQVEYLVNQDCIRHLCDIVFAECKPKNIAIRALKRILEVGISYHMPHILFNVQIVAHLLQEWADENLQLGRELKKLELLNKKKELLCIDKQYRQVQKNRCQREFLKELENKANEIVPRKEWHTWLVNNNFLPTDIEALIDASEESMSKVNCIRSRQIGSKRNADVGMVSVKLRALFRDKGDMAARQKKRASTEEGKDPASKSYTIPKRRGLHHCDQ